jgi:hypothetical protein
MTRRAVAGLNFGLDTTVSVLIYRCTGRETESVTVTAFPFWDVSKKESSDKSEHSKGARPHILNPSFQQQRHFSDFVIRHSFVVIGYFVIRHSFVIGYFVIRHSPCRLPDPGILLKCPAFNRGRKPCCCNAFQSNALLKRAFTLRHGISTYY